MDQPTSVIAKAFDYLLGYVDGFSVLVPSSAVAAGSTRTYQGVVVSQAAMLALSPVAVGDWCERSDLANQVFELTAAGPATLANWTAYPGGSSSTLVPYSTTIPLTYIGGGAVMPQTPLTANSVFTPGAAPVAQAACQLILVGDGTHAPTFTAWTNANGYSYNAASGARNVYTFGYIGGVPSFPALWGFAGPTQIFSDNFNRANSTPIGSPWVSVGISDAYGLLSNQVSYVSGTSAAKYVADTLFVQNTIQADFVCVIGRYSILIFRYTDINNYWYMTVLDNIQRVQIHKVIAGVDTTIGLGAASDGALNVVLTAKIVISGTTLTASLNGVTKATATDAAITGSTGTQVGFGIDSPGGAETFDNYVANP